MKNEASNNAVNLSQANSASSVALELQLVRAGAVEFGILTDDISAIVAWREPAPLPYAPNTVLGVVSIEGRMLTVLDLARLQVSAEKVADVPRASSGHIVGLRGDEQLALAVDSVDEKIELANSDFETTASGHIMGVLRRNGAEINVLNLKELFPTAIQGHERRRRRF